MEDASIWIIQEVFMSKLSHSPDQCPEAVPVKVNRIFDSCSDRDCLSNVQITLDECGLPPSVTLVKSRCIKVANICITVEQVPFNRGFYSIDLTYTFKVELMAYEKACSSPMLITGTAYASKNVILYGGESSSKVFTSDKEASCTNTDMNCCCETINLPTASVQVVEPIALETKIVNNSQNPCECGKHEHERAVVMTIGLFSVVELYRPVTIMVPTYEYTIPTKECHTDVESPCAVFDKIRFPAEEFSPGTISGCSEQIKGGECGNCQGCCCGSRPYDDSDNNDNS